ncbi:MAG: redoxin domain-containing protein [Deltaproteobacteria bacterium]|nr:redoxin domain-containing protein [Deltaproteobacteria bacterium]
MKNLFFIAIALSSLTLFSTTAVALETGVQAPNFTLNAFNVGPISLSDFVGKYVVLEWFNPYCPTGRKYYQNNLMQQLQKDYVLKGIVWLTISSTNKQNDDYIDDGRAKYLVKGKKMGSTYVLDDSEGIVGKLYNARTTPHIFIIDPKGRLIYQGAVDNDWDMFEKPTEEQNFVRLVLDSALSKKRVPVGHTPVYGCHIKY